MTDRISSTDFDHKNGRRKDYGDLTGKNSEKLISYDHLEPWIVGNLTKRIYDRFSASAERIDPYIVPLGSVIRPDLKPLVWGGGLADPLVDHSIVLRGVRDIRLVRGPWTQRVLRAHGYTSDVHIGEPMLLFGSLFPEFKFTSPRRAPGILVAVEGQNTQEAEALASHNSCSILDPDDSPIQQIELIAGARLVVSTSVAVIAIAESYSVPARFIDPTNEGAHYFVHRDYLSGTNRPFEMIKKTLQESIELGGFPQPGIDKEAILSSFPINFVMNDSTLLDRFDDEPLPKLVEGYHDWSESIQSGGSKSADFLANLDKAVTLDAASLEGLINELYNFRYWLAPNIDLCDSDERRKSLDFLIRESPKDLEKIRLVHQDEFISEIYSAVALSTGILLSMVITTPRILDIPVSIEFKMESGGTTNVDIPENTTVIGQTLIDIDTYIADINVEELDTMRVVLYFESGFIQEMNTRKGRAPWCIPVVS